MPNELENMLLIYCDRNLLTINDVFQAEELGDGYYKVIGYAPNHFSFVVQPYDVAQEQRDVC